MKKLLIFLSILFAVSCSTININQPKQIGDTFTTKYTIFQTYNNYSGLAYDENYNVAKIISFDTNFYDGLVIKSKWVMINTHTYITVKNICKTVPVYMKSKEYKEKYH